MNYQKEKKRRKPHYKNIKYLRINLTDKVKDLYTENYQDVVERNWRRHKDLKRFSMFMNGKSNIIKMSILPKTMYRFNASPIKIPMAFFSQKQNKKFLKCVWNHKRPEITKAFLKNKNKTGGIRLPHTNNNTKL